MKPARSILVTSTVSRMPQDLDIHDLILVSDASFKVLCDPATPNIVQVHLALHDVATLKMLVACPFPAPSLLTRQPL